MKFEIPAALKQEHDDLRANVAAAGKEPGALGEAARELAHLLEAHLAKEEQLVYPPLGLLPAVVEGRITEEMAEAVAMTRQLKDDLADMLLEHRRIQDALRKLRAAAASASRPAYERFADALIAHIETEEEVIYPASMLVGEHVAQHLERQRAKGLVRTAPPWRSRPVP